MVHHKDTLFPLCIICANSKTLPLDIPVFSSTSSNIYFFTCSLNPSKSSVYFSIYSLSTHPFLIRTFANVYKSTKSVFGFISIHISQFVTVSVLLGSMPIFIQSLLFFVFPQRIGCATTGLQPINIITSECSKSLNVYGGASNPKLCL